MAYLEGFTLEGIELGGYAIEDTPGLVYNLTGAGRHEMGAGKRVLALRETAARLRFVQGPEVNSDYLSQELLKGTPYIRTSSRKSLVRDVDDTGNQTLNLLHTGVSWTQYMACQFPVRADRVGIMFATAGTSTGNTGFMLYVDGRSGSEGRVRAWINNSANILTAPGVWVADEMCLLRIAYTRNGNTNTLSLHRMRPNAPNVPQAERLAWALLGTVTNTSTPAAPGTPSFAKARYFVDTGQSWLGDHLVFNETLRTQAERDYFNPQTEAVLIARHLR